MNNVKGSAVESYNELEVISLCFTKEGLKILLNHHFEIIDNGREQRNCTANALHLCKDDNRFHSLVSKLRTDYKMKIINT